MFRTIANKKSSSLLLSSSTMFSWNGLLLWILLIQLPSLNVFICCVDAFFILPQQWVSPTVHHLLNDQQLHWRQQSNRPKHSTIVLMGGQNSNNDRDMDADTNSDNDDGVTSSTCTTPPHTGALPKVIVFDLDNTLWTPELYQLRRRLQPQGQGRSRQQQQQQPKQKQRTPVAGKDVKLFRGAEQILKEIIPTYYNQKNGTASSTSHKKSDDEESSSLLPLPPLLAIASRTQSVDWAQDLVTQFGLRDSFVAIEIYPGSKIKHFTAIQQITGVQYNEMIFFDDARDGKFGNCIPVSSLGVLCVHCPQGLITTDIFTRALDIYTTKWDKTPSTIVEWDGQMTTTTTANGTSSSSAAAKSAAVTTATSPQSSLAELNQLLSSTSSTSSFLSISKGIINGLASDHLYEGVIKMVRTEKRFGFIRYRGPVKSRDVFFHFNNVVMIRSSSSSSSRRSSSSSSSHRQNDDGHDDSNIDNNNDFADVDADEDDDNDDNHNNKIDIQEGDGVVFQIQRDPWNPSKTMAVNVKVVSSVSSVSSSSGILSPPSLSSPDPSGASSTTTMVQFRCFSMNQPFAALLANGYKTLETRNGTMFTAYAEGTQMLLHVGKRTYPDGGKHVDIMKKQYHKTSNNNSSTISVRQYEGLGDDAVSRLKSLPPGFSRGDIVAIVELGKTYETSMTERCDPEFERRAVAYGTDSGRFVTEIVRATYLKRPVKRKGEGGVFKVHVDPSVIPDEYYLPTVVGSSAIDDAANDLFAG
jgi:magnesium-dependent phosphatase 1